MRELQSLLRKSLKIEQLEILEYSETRLLPPGENYNSIIVKLDVTIAKENNAEMQTLHLLAKMPPPNRENSIMNWTTIFNREVFIYTELMPMYRNFERDVGIEEKDLIDILPKYLGHRHSLDANCKEADEDSVLLMENLTTRGFHTVDKSVGLDVQHAKKALTNLAKFHAIGMALKQKRPNWFEKAIAQSHDIGVNLDIFHASLESVLRIFQGDPRFKRYLGRIESGFKSLTGESPQPSKWYTLTHGDFWVNNILFHEDGEGNVDDVKFVDYQSSIYSHALRELPYFFSISIDEVAKKNHCDELLELYYESLVRTLKRSGYDDTTFTKDAFFKEVKSQAIRQFIICAFIKKCHLHAVSDVNPDPTQALSTILSSQYSDEYKEKLNELVSFYENMRWFS